MKNDILLEWRYEPKTYVEEPYQIQGVGYVIDIGNGTVKVTLDSKYENDKDIVKKIQSNVVSYLLGIQIVNCKSCDLVSRLLGIPKIIYNHDESSEPLKIKVYPDGSRDLIISGGLSMVVRASMSADAILKHNGIVVRDIRKERRNEERHLAELINKYIDIDTTLKAIIESHTIAINDPRNELIHLQHFA